MSVTEPEVARSLATEGVIVVVVGRDAGEVGSIVASITEAGGRAAAFVGDPAVDTERAALVEMVDELFPDRPIDAPDAPEPA